jgi:hypothetical protein
MAKQTFLNRCVSHLHALCPTGQLKPLIKSRLMAMRAKLRSMSKRQPGAGAVAFFAGVLAFSAPWPSAAKTIASGMIPRVLASLPLSGHSVESISLQPEGGRTLLYLSQPDRSQVLIVDVSNPSKPHITGSFQYPDRTGPGQFVVLNSRTGLLLGNARTAAAENPNHSYSLTLVDLANPTEPQPVLHFRGIRAYKLDSDRGLLYLATKHRLVVVRDAQLENPGVQAWREFAMAP